MIWFGIYTDLFVQTGNFGEQNYSVIQSLPNLYIYNSFQSHHLKAPSIRQDLISFQWELICLVYIAVMCFYVFVYNILLTYTNRFKMLLKSRNIDTIRIWCLKHKSIERSMFVMLNDSKAFKKMHQTGQVNLWLTFTRMSGKYLHLLLKIYFS